MSGRRGHHEGSIYKRKHHGLWVAVLDLGYVGGKRKRRTFYASTQREVSAKLAAARLEIEKGIIGTGQRATLETYLRTWLEQRDPRTPSAGVKKLRYTTWVAYEARMRLHVCPTLGRTPIGRLTADHVRDVIAKMSASELSATTVAMVRDSLSTILKRAVKDRILPYNPVDGVDSVARSAPRRYQVTPDQANALLRSAAAEPFEAVFVLALHTGLRESEVFGLKWADLNLDRAELTVRQALVPVKGVGLRTFDPKTRSSAATIPLTSTAVAALRAQRVRQLEQRLAAGSDWVDSGHVFTTERGTPVRASNFLRRHFYRVAERAGIPTRLQPDGTFGCRFHDLRHGCGSLLISLGVKPKLVQTILRHSKLSTTMDLYVHAFDDDLRDAVATLERAVR